jgi:DNA-binding transcriptional regulator YiaG
MKRFIKTCNTSNLAAIRCGHGYTQSQFALLLGIPKSTLAMAECGKRDLPNPAFLKMAYLEIERVEREKQLAGTVVKEHEMPIT